MLETAATSDASTDTHSDTPVAEVVPGRLYRLGGFIPLDGRISWAPTIPGCYTPHSNFIIFEQDRAYLIDTGVAAQRATVQRQIKGLVPPEMPITAFLTRGEFTCAGNLAALCIDPGIDELVSAARNPFAGSDEISRELEDSVRRTQTERGAVSALGSSKELLVIPPLIRLLSAFWVYDKVSKTMFTADLFGHIHVASLTDVPIADSVADDTTTYEQVREHTLCRYHWLPIAETEALVSWIKKVFDTFEVDNIASTSGCVIKGRPMVEKHFGLMVELLERVPRESN